MVEMTGRKRPPERGCVDDDSAFVHDTSPSSDLTERPIGGSLSGTTPVSMTKRPIGGSLSGTTPVSMTKCPDGGILSGTRPVSTTRLRATGEPWPSTGVPGTHAANTESTTSDNSCTDGNDIDTLRVGKGWSINAVGITKSKAVRFTCSRRDGDYVLNPDNFVSGFLKGVTPATTLGENVYSPEGHWSPHFLRHPGAPHYPTACLFAGVGVDAMAGLGAGQIPKFAAEVDPTRRHKFYKNTGVTAAVSNEHLTDGRLARVPVWSFGFECNGVARPGRRLGREDKSWQSFLNVVEALDRYRPLSIRIENVPGLLTHDNGEMVRDVLRRLRDVGYTCIYGSANPKDFGVAVDRERVYFIGVLSPEAEAVGLQKMRVPDRPFSTGECKRRCVADSLTIPGTQDTRKCDAIHYHVFAAQQLTAGVQWRIEWNEDFDTEEKRKALKRMDGTTRQESITIGYLRRAGRRKSTRTGFKICHAYGLMPGITSSVKAEGPGKQRCFFYIPGTGDVRTLSSKEIKKLWCTENLEASVQDLGLTAHPITTTAVALMQTLILDKIFTHKGTCPRLPAVVVNTIDDLLSDVGMEALWGSKFNESACQEHRRLTDGRSARLGPQRHGDRVYKHPLLTLFIWSLADCETGGSPVRVNSRSRHPSSPIDLRYLSLEGYDDPGIVDDIRHLGMCGNSCPAHETILQTNGKAWIEHEDVGVQWLEDAAERKEMHFSGHIPFLPYHINPLFVVEQKDKMRPIFNKNGGPDGTSLNEQASKNERAQMRLINLDGLCRGIAVLQGKVMEMRSLGWRVGMTLSWVDLYSAYIQTGVDRREEWMNGCGYVKVQSGGHREFRYGYTTQSQFGGECTPFGFSRITRATTYSGALRLRSAKDYLLQERWRQMLKESEPRVLRQFVPRQVAGRKRRWSETEAFEEELLERQGKKEHVSQAWNNISPEDGLTADNVHRVLGASASVIEGGDLFQLGTYIDDTLLFSVHEMNNGDTVGGASDEGSGEYLRTKYIRAGLEECKLVVVGNKKSQKKFVEGECSPVNVALGFKFDFSDPECPRIGLKEDKITEYGRGVSEILKRTHECKMLPFKEVESLAHKLNHACQVILRGKVYTGGLFAALRGKRESGWVCVTRWMKRNLRWWVQYFEEGRIPERIIMTPPALPARDCPYTDASTSWGCGGYWLEGHTCYYFHEMWTPDEATLVEENEMGINFLELATVLFLLEASGSHFDGKSITLYCDNDVSVEMLTSAKSRTAKMSALLEQIDSLVSKHNINIYFEWIDTVQNKLADCLSRDSFETFKEEITKRYGACEYVQVVIDPQVRDIGGIVREALGDLDSLEEVAGR
jgi:site-specific DNA-cytosine methylase